MQAAFKYAGIEDAERDCAKNTAYRFRVTVEAGRCLQP